jgi:hypothetical protein
VYSSVSRSEENPEPEGDILFLTNFSDVALGVHDDTTFAINNQAGENDLSFYWWGPNSKLPIASYGGGRRLECAFDAGSERTAGIVSQGAIAGAGKILHVAMLLECVGYPAEFSGIKKIFRLRANGTTIFTVNFQNERIRGDFESSAGFFDQTEGSAATHGPATFIDQARWLEVKLDITDPDAPIYEVWVDGTSVLAGTAGAIDVEPTDNLDSFYVMTTFNGPADDGTDLITQLIVANGYIGV